MFIITFTISENVFASYVSIFDDFLIPTSPKGFLDPDPAARWCPTPAQGTSALQGCGTWCPLGIRSLYTDSANTLGINISNTPNLADMDITHVTYCDINIISYIARF